MAKFKVGDRVEIVDGGNGTYGSIGYISSVLNRSCDYYDVTTPSGTYHKLGSNIRLFQCEHHFVCDKCGAEYPRDKPADKPHEYKVGDRVIITQDSNCHCLPIGSVQTLCSKSLSGNWLIGGVYVPECDMKPCDKPAVREVKRPAKVGEWVKIIETDGTIPNGRIVQCTDISRNIATAPFPGDNKYGVFHFRYVVLENYHPEPSNPTEHPLDVVIDGKRYIREDARGDASSCALL